MPDVDKQDDAPKDLAVDQVVFHHLAPGLLDLLVDLGIAVAREVDEIELTVNQEVVDGPGLAG